MSTVERRMRIREALIDTGFHRKMASHDSGDGVYGEYWGDDEDNQIVISWAPRSES